MVGATYLVGKRKKKRGGGGGRKRKNKKGSSFFHTNFEDGINFGFGRGLRAKKHVGMDQLAEKKKKKVFVI
jgi:hypothetical protein